jgi:hypothetical protein
MLVRVGWYVSPCWITIDQSINHETQELRRTLYAVRHRRRQSVLHSSFFRNTITSHLSLAALHTLSLASFLLASFPESFITAACASPLFAHTPFPLVSPCSINMRDFLLRQPRSILSFSRRQGVGCPCYATSSWLWSWRCMMGACSHYSEFVCGFASHLLSWLELNDEKRCKFTLMIRAHELYYAHCPLLSRSHYPTMASIPSLGSSR